jgi:hypothetical protein
MTDFALDGQKAPTEEDLLNDSEESDKESSREFETLDDAKEEKLVKRSFEIQNSSNHSQEDNDEDELALSDDAEADLLTLLEGKLNLEDQMEEDDEDEKLSFEVPTLEGEITLIPRRSNEVHCPRCWFLIHENFSRCPLGDDDCPLFSLRVD